MPVRVTVLGWLASLGAADLRWGCGDNGHGHNPGQLRVPSAIGDRMVGSSLSVHLDLEHRPGIRRCRVYE